MKNPNNYTGLYSETKHYRKIDKYWYTDRLKFCIFYVSFFFWYEKLYFFIFFTDAQNRKVMYNIGMCANQKISLINIIKSWILHIQFKHITMAMSNKDRNVDMK